MSQIQRVAIILALGICLPFIIYGAHRAEQSIENRPDDWLPAHFEETQQLRWFERTFGGDEQLMISYPGCGLEDRRISELAKHLAAAGLAGKPAFSRVTTGSELLAELCDEPLNLSREQALDRLRGWVVGPNGETCVVATMSPEGKLDRPKVLDQVKLAIADVGLPADSLKMAGTTMENIAINEASTEWYTELSFASLAVGVVLMYLFFRSVAITLMVFGTALISERLSLAWMHFSDTPTDSVSTMTPGLVYVLAISSGVHLANYYRDELTIGDLQSAPRRAVRNAWKPCLLATLTTAIGLGSLLISDLDPVRRFGVFSAIGVAGMLFVQFLVLPFLLERFPPRSWAAKMQASLDSDPLTNVWGHWSHFVEDKHALIMATSMALCVLGALGLGRLEATARLHDLLPKNARLLQDYAWLETHIGPLVPLEVVLRFPDNDGSKIVERVRLVEEVRREIVATPDVGNAVSAATWLPPLPASNGGLQNVIRRSVLNRFLESGKDGLQQTGYFRELDSEQLWRISAAAKASDNSLDYGQLMHGLKSRIDPLLERYNVETGRHITAVYTGSVPLLHRIQSQLLNDLIASFLAALVMITLVMIVVMRSISAGLLCMIPNVLPSVIVFGALGWMGPSIEIGAMMTAGTAIGIAVDDTLHFMTWFQRGLNQELSRVGAVRFAFRNCATAMLQTSMICGLGLLVFALSPFIPAARFGWMLAALLGTALLGDLVVLPALLVGPLGCVVRPSASTRRRIQSPRSATVDAKV